jgi:hypothetical protein
MAQKFLRSTIGQITSASGRRILASRAAALLIKVYDCRVQALAWEGGEYPYLARTCWVSVTAGSLETALFAPAGVRFDRQSDLQRAGREFFHR